MIPMLFTKQILTDKYVIMFNKKTGIEMITGLNGHPDPFILDSPNMIDIGIMGHCSNNCKICYQGNINIPNMTLDDFKSIIDQCKSHINQVALGGKGDPNKHENFKEIIEYCKSNNVVPNYTTSGKGLTDEEVDLTLKNCGAVAVSSYNEDFTFIALNKFLNVGMKTNIHYVVSKETFDNAIKLLNGEDIWNNKFPLDKLNGIVLLLFKPQGNGSDKKYLCLSDEQIKEFANIFLKNPKCKFKIGCDSCMVNKVANSRPLTKMEKISLDTCEGSRMSCYISPDMMFMPCSFGNKEIFGTKINSTNTIQSIWDNSSAFKMFRKKLKENSRQCPYDL